MDSRTRPLPTPHSPLPPTYGAGPPWRAPRPQSVPPWRAPRLQSSRPALRSAHCPGPRAQEGRTNSGPPSRPSISPRSSGDFRCSSPPEGSTADLPFVTPGQDCSLTDPCTRVTLSQLARAGKASLALSEGPHRAEYTGAREGATEVTLSSRGLGNSEQGDEPPSA